MDDLTIGLGVISAIILVILVMFAPVMIWCDVTNSYAEICGPRFENVDGKWVRDYGDE